MLHTANGRTQKQLTGKLVLLERNEGGAHAKTGSSASLQCRYMTKEGWM